jgi:hypothetical protein
MNVSRVGGIFLSGHMAGSKSRIVARADAIA